MLRSVLVLSAVAAASAFSVAPVSDRCQLRAPHACCLCTVLLRAAWAGGSESGPHMGGACGAGGGGGKEGRGLWRDEVR